MITTLSKIQLISLLSIVLLYSISTPWPKEVGMVEIIIMCLLIIFLSSPMLKTIMFYDPTKSILFSFILFIPLVNGFLINQNAFSDIIRDLIPYLYLSMPIIFLSQKVQQEQIEKLLFYTPMALSFTGVIYSIRELYQFRNDIFSMFTTSDYLVQAPLVLFSALYLLLSGLYALHIRNYLKAYIYILISIIPISTFYLTVLRGPFVLILCFAFIYFILLNIRKKIKLLVVSFLLVLCALYFMDNIVVMLSAFIQKQSVHGTNGKMDEVYMMIDVILNQEDLKTIIIGKGWGGTWYSPAAGGEVRFAHSLFVYALLKFGSIGIVLFAVWFFYLCKIGLFIFMNSDNKSKSLLLTIIPIMIVNIWLEPGFKTLDFGIILLLYNLQYVFIKSNKQKNSFTEVKKIIYN